MVFDIGTLEEGSEEMEWFQTLEADHLTLSYSYSSVSGLSLEKEGNSFTVTANKTTLSSYYTYTMKIAIPGYDAVAITFTPVKAPPAITQQWNQENYSLILTGNASYLSSYPTKVVLNGTELKKGEAADYTASYNKGIEIFPHNFTAGSPYRIELYASAYGIKVIEGTAPADLVSPLEAPVLKSEAVVQKGTVTVEVVSGEADDWLNNISSVTLADSYSSTAVTYTKNENGLTLPTVSSYSPGTYTVTVNAKGYRAAQAEIRILYSISVKGAMNYDEERLELTTTDSYFYDKVTVSLNGTELKKGTGYTTSGYNTIYIPAELLTEEENLLVLYNEAYQKVELSFGQYIAYEPAPKLAVENGTSSSGENTIVLHVADGNQEWWDSLIQSHVSVKRSSSSQTITGFSKNADEEQLTITLSGTLSNYYGYNVTISVPGYRSCNVSFTPYQKLPDITDEWLENGDLQFSTDTSYYFYSSYNTVYLDGEKLTSGTDYSLNTRTKPYSLTILAKKFTSEEHEVRILSEYNNYAPYEITVTVPEIQNYMNMEARKLIMQEPVAEVVEKPESEEGNKPSEENAEEVNKPSEENEEEVNTVEESTEEENRTEDGPAEESPAEESPTEESPSEESLEENSSKEKYPEENLTEEPLVGEAEPDGGQELNEEEAFEEILMGRANSGTSEYNFARDFSQE
ncbi:MAG TPA: hypothetical protein DC053_02650 [Lachnoclostridium sp.]|nr:hypothetical protein [Lachnoclostridium sp.]